MYFIYDDKMVVSVMKQFCPSATQKGVAMIKGQRLVFRGEDFSARACLDVVEGEHVYGILFKIPKNEAEVLQRDMRLHGYLRAKIEVIVGRQTVECFYFRKIAQQELHKPTEEYFRNLVEAFAENDLPLGSLVQSLRYSTT